MVLFLLLAVFHQPPLLTVEMLIPREYPWVPDSSPHLHHVVATLLPPDGWNQSPSFIFVSRFSGRRIPHRVRDQSALSFAGIVVFLVGVCSLGS